MSWSADVKPRRFRGFFLKFLFHFKKLISVKYCPVKRTFCRIPAVNVGHLTKLGNDFHSFDHFVKVWGVFFFRRNIVRVGRGIVLTIAFPADEREQRDRVAKAKRFRGKALGTIRRCFACQKWLFEEKPPTNVQVSGWIFIGGNLNGIVWLWTAFHSFLIHGSQRVCLQVVTLMAVQFRHVDHFDFSFETRRDDDETPTFWRKKIL